MSEVSRLVCVNEKQAYHNCEMLFSFYYHNAQNGYRVDESQVYKIHTTIKEFALLNEALHLYQEDGFKDKYLMYVSEVDGSNVYPLFAGDYIESVTLTKRLQAFAHDEDSLVQLSSYCLEVPPMYRDYFMINKKIEALILDGKEHRFDGFDDIQAYLEGLQTSRAELFV